MEWWTHVFQHVKFDPEIQPIIYCDNEQTVRIAKQEDERCKYPSDVVLRELRGLWRLWRKVYCYGRGYEPYLYQLCVSTDVGPRQTVVRLRWAVEVEIDYWVP
jgi:hypothetical protein